MARNFVLGLAGKLYYLDDGGGGIGVRDPAGGDTGYGNDKGTVNANRFVEICFVQDVSSSLSPRTSEVSTRCGAGWVETVPTLKEGTVDTTLLWRPDEAIFQLLLNQVFLLNRSIPLLIMDGDICAATASDRVTGLYADFIIGDFVRNEALEDAMTADVTFSISPGATPPHWVNDVGAVACP